MTIKLPKFIGHRGVKDLIPENTIQSINKAIELSLKWVEVDVKISKDFIPFLLHDDNLERTTNGFGLCCDHNFDDLLKLDAGSWFNNNFAEERNTSFSNTWFLQKHNDFRKTYNFQKSIVSNIYLNT